VRNINYKAHVTKLIFFFFLAGFEKFVVEAEKYGVKRRELLAMEMKQRGMSIARRLFFWMSHSKLKKSLFRPLS